MLSSVHIMAADHSNTIWNKKVPLKVNLISLPGVYFVIVYQQHII